MSISGKKAIFLDLDGTLLTDDKKVPEANRIAIEKMLGEGNSVVIATGRPLSSAVIQAERLGLTRYIGKKRNLPGNSQPGTGPKSV